MKKLYLTKKIISFFSILFFVFSLSGCSSFLNFSLFTNENVNFHGNIYSKSIKIPHDSVVTLSITSMDSLGSIQKTNYDYRFIVKEASTTIAFAISLPELQDSNNKNLGISVRIEKEGKLIMMSNDMTFFTPNNTDNLSLSVGSI